jgi:hypothetical protein
VNSSMLMPAPIMAGQPRPARRRAPPPTSQRRSRSSCARSVPAGSASSNDPSSHGQPRILLGERLLNHPQRTPLRPGQRHRTWPTHVRRSPNLSATLRPPRRAGPSSAAARRIGMAVTPRSPWEPPPCWRKPCAAHHGRHPTGVVLTRPGWSWTPQVVHRGSGPLGVRARHHDRRCPDSQVPVGQSSGTGDEAAEWWGDREIPGAAGRVRCSRRRWAGGQGGPGARR